MKTRRGRGRSRRTRDVVRRQAALVASCSRASRCRPTTQTAAAHAIRLVLDELGKNHGKPEDARRRRPKDRRRRSRRFIRDKNILTLPDPDTLQGHRDAGVPARLLGGVPEPGPAARPEGRQPLRRRPAAEATGPPARVETFLREYNSAMLQILTIHEAYPGHYVQLAYSNRCPSLIRKVLSSGTFAEGWAVYTEQMMLDQGYGDGDLSLRLHQLKFYHAGGPQRDPRPQDALREHDRRGGDEAARRARLPDGGRSGRQDRCGRSRSSTQLSTYFVGRTAFYRLRQDVQRKQGDEFDLGEVSTRRC